MGEDLRTPLAGVQGTPLHAHGVGVVRRGEPARPLNVSDDKNPIKRIFSATQPNTNRSPLGLRTLKER